MEFKFRWKLSHQEIMLNRVKQTVAKWPKAVELISA